MFSEFLTVALVHLLAVMSPGPDFVMITRNSLVYSRRTGLYSSVGLGLGILVHVTYSLVGIGLLISKSIVLFNAIKLLGAGYLVYIGIKSLRAKPAQANEAESEKKDDLSRLAAIKMGFLTNALNPKASLFFFALFSQVIHQETPKFIQALYGLEMGLATFAWFALVSSALSLRAVKARFAKVQHIAERFFGAVLVALGIKVALSSSK